MRAAAAFIVAALLEAGRVLLEAHPSASAQVRAGVLQALRESEVAGSVDLSAAQRVLDDVWGTAVDVSNKKAAKTAPTSTESAQAELNGKRY